MIVPADIALWFAFVVPGLLCSMLSLQCARNVHRAVHIRKARPEVLDDTHHVIHTTTLLVLGWLVFSTIGVVALVEQFNGRTRSPITPTGVLILWSLIAAVGVWAVMTVSDYTYTRKVWRRIGQTVAAQNHADQPLNDTSLDYANH